MNWDNNPLIDKLLTAIKEKVSTMTTYSFNLIEIDVKLKLYIYYSEL
jgi:hypothetical protein